MDMPGRSAAIPSTQQSAPETPARRIVVSGITDVGPTRSENQDALASCGIVALKSGTRIRQNLLVTSPACIAVIDGMGGYAGGGDAAALAACEMAKLEACEEREINEFLSQLSRKISFAGGAWQMPDMGAALALLMVQPHRTTIANVGDCRVYRCTNDTLGLWSQDDTVSSGFSALTQALGANTNGIDAHVYHLEHEESFGRFVLCSDGVWGTLDERAELEPICCKGASPEIVVQDLSRTCYEKQARDNFSAIVVDISPTGNEEANHVG